MLEESNVLVYSEAIKTVELLSQILGSSSLVLKPKKVKQYVGLLVEKYKETKSAVVVAINKALSTIFTSYLHFTFQTSIETLFALICGQQKNPRVKHMVLEKIASLVNE
jgi:hypothetical protein